MKYTIPLIAIMLLLLSCKDNLNDSGKRNEKWVWWTDAKTGKSSWIPVTDNTSTVKDGTYTRFYFNGQVFSKGKLVDGKDVDTIFSYNMNGHLQAYLFPRKDTSRYFDEYLGPIAYFIKNGPVKTYYQNGHPELSGIIKDHMYGDKCIIYFKNGNIEYLLNLKNDTGWATSYYDNGKIRDSDYCQGKNLFHIKHWFITGQLERSVEFKNGDYNGLQKDYYFNGRLKSVGTNINGKQAGKITQWYEDGKLQAIVTETDGKYDGPGILYYENGIVKAVANAKNGKLDGEAKSYDESGKLIKDGIFKDGVLVEDKLSHLIIH